MTGPLRPLTSFGQIEDRLRRALNLVGDVGMSFSPAAIPVVSVMDATAPGNPTTRGRRFQDGVRLPNIAAASDVALVYKAVSDVVITRVATSTLSAGVGHFLQYVWKGVADPAVPLATQCCLFTERNASSQDYAPMVRSSTFVNFATVLNDGKVISYQYPQNGYMVEHLTQPLFMEAGTKLYVTLAAIAGTANSTCILSGYVY